LRDLFFEGETLSVQLAKFLFKSSVQHLEKISLAVEKYTSDIKGKHIFERNAQELIMVLYIKVGCSKNKHINIFLFLVIFMFEEILGLLISYPRPRLKTLTLYFGTFGPTTDRNACGKFIKHYLFAIL
jgi:hypothetical protein